MPMWCDSCGQSVRTDNEFGKTCCSLCGRVLAEDNFAEEATFVKTADGQARMAGNIVRSIQSESTESRKRTLDDAHYGVESMMYAMGIDGGDEISGICMRIYRMALDKNFTRGRRKEQVQAAILYTVCRMKEKPYLLIDFSEYLRINVYVLGAVFLQLCKKFNLSETPILQKLVDPSLFIHRFADRLFRGGNPQVSKTALHIVASMKRDWMQTGRKPSGLCGAALYISALAYGLKCSKSEIIKVVHICEATLTKRLIEFENTESGGLTIEEFESKSKEFDKQADNLDDYESQMQSLNTGQKVSGSGELLCEHKGTETPQFAYGLCKDCYKYFMILSGGLNGGSEPPAFQRAEKKRIMAEEAAADNSENLDSSMFTDQTSDEQRSIKKTNENDVIQSAHTDSTGATLQSETVHDTSNDRMDASDFTLEESETLSDIDDVEVDVYINTEEEKNLKTTVWEEINREYLEEQAAKEAAKNVEGTRKFSAESAAAAAQIRKEKRQKRAAELKNLGPPETAAEAVKQMLHRKGLNSRIRYDVLEQVLQKPEDKITKKSRMEPELEPEHDYTEEYHYEENYNYDEDYNDMDDT